jgi:hypothetical protein
MNVKNNNPGALFAANANQYWEAGLPVIPLVKNDKRPAIKNWTSFCVNVPSKTTRQNWIKGHANCNLGLALGLEVEEGWRLSAIDVDDDRFVPFIRSFLGGPDISKKGKKGFTAFVLSEKSIKSTVLKLSDGGHAIDFLSYGKQTVLPPSIHPDTSKAYKWSEKSLPEVSIDGLPKVNQAWLRTVETVVAEPGIDSILSGSGTHEAALRLTAKLVGIVSDEIIVDVISAILPTDYKGNTLDELPEMIASAREKGFDRRTGYDPGEKGPVPLGVTEGRAYVFWDNNLRQVIAASAQQLTSPAGLLNLAARKFWAKQFPKTDSNGVPTGDLNPQWAGDVLMQTCRGIGPFSLSTVRGRGVWLEGDRRIINVGDEISEDAKYRYVCFEPLSEIPGRADQIDPSDILEVLKLFHWRDEKDATLLFGWAVIAPVCGVLSWRPHIFLHGPKHTGKTTVSCPPITEPRNS